MQIKPFQAWCARPDLAAQVAAVPYDVVDTEEARALASGNPLSFLHVSRAEIDMPAGVNPYSDAVYTRGHDTLLKFQQDGTLLQEKTPQLYLYRQTMGQHVQRGIVACCSTVDYERHVIKTHEKTRQDKEDDRTRHIKAHHAQSGPVFLIYRDSTPIQALVHETEQHAPLFDFVAPDGIGHAGWRFTAPNSVSALFRSVPVAYIADGHHRAAASVRVAREHRAANPAHSGQEDYDWFLGVLFPASEVQILPYNRLVRDLNGQSPDTFLRAVRGRFTVRSTHKASPSAPGTLCMFLAGAWHELSWTLPPGTSPESRLDVSVLQERLLDPILGIDDPRTSKRIEFAGGIRGTDELEHRVNSGQHAVAFAMHPATVSQMMDIADAGGIMPPKSTWFEPKLRDGLFIHSLD
jgi:uncharacterized protein (DUF1015 family)